MGDGLKWCCSGRIPKSSLISASLFPISLRTAAVDDDDIGVAVGDRAVDWHTLGVKADPFGLVLVQTLDEHARLCGTEQEHVVIEGLSWQPFPSLGSRHTTCTTSSTAYSRTSGANGRAVHICRTLLSLLRLNQNMQLVYHCIDRESVGFQELVEPDDAFLEVLSPSSSSCDAGCVHETPGRRPTLFRSILSTNLSPSLSQRQIVHNFGDLFLPPARLSASQRWLRGALLGSVDQKMYT